MSSASGIGGKSERPVSWIQAARKDFKKFPHDVKMDILTALEIAASGQTADSAKQMKGLGPGVYEIALRYQTNAYRAVYAVKLGDWIWVVHAFQKKSKTGIKTPPKEIEKIKTRIKSIKEMLKDDK